MMDTELVPNAKEFATQYAKYEIPSKFVFHSIQHISEAVKAATELAVAYNLPAEDIEDIKIAMWFHDLGFSGGWEGHEERSMQLVEKFLKEQQQTELRISKIQEYIAATRQDAVPKNLIEEIIHDADTSHIGTKKYFQKLGLLRTEWEEMEGKKFSEKKWLKLNLKFLEEHKFYSAMGEAEYGRRKRKNMLKLQTYLQELVSYEKVKVNSEEVENNLKLPKKAKRGVETMFRVTLRNHNNLSRIADNKANIMLSINAIMLSIVVSTLTPKLDANPRLIVPTVIIIIVCMVSIVLATISTRPKITSANYSDEKFLARRFNILFFGNFYQMPLDKFEWGIQNLMQNEQLLYSSLSKDLYYLGLVLAKKYKYLNICHNIFMIGLVVAAISFIISFLPAGPS